MIKIEKDFEDVPVSLDGEITGNRRGELIAHGGYISKKKYNDRYKTKDIKDKLQLLYFGKCAFCETRVEQWHVEHFRPKSKYYWLAFSWDNLLVACPSCNTHKFDHFEVLRHVALQPDHLGRIHQLNQEYDQIEESQFFNPESGDDPEVKLNFEKDGSVSSKDPKLDYTIRRCKLDRAWLNDRRSKLWFDLRKRLESRYLELRKGDRSARQKLRGLLEDFREMAQDPDKEYLAFRRFAATNWL